MKLPTAETVRLSAISYLRELNGHEEAELLGRCKLEIGSSQGYAGTTIIGLNITLRCRASDLYRFKDQDSVWGLPSNSHELIKEALKSVLPAELTVHEISARSFLVDRGEFEKSELERLIEAQKDVMVAVATGGPRIESKNQDYKDRWYQIREKLNELGKQDPNPFEDLWAWYGRWRSGDLPSYQSRREYIRDLYQHLLEDLPAPTCIIQPNPAANQLDGKKLIEILTA